MSNVYEDAARERKVFAICAEADRLGWTTAADLDAAATAIAGDDDAWEALHQLAGYGHASEQTRGMVVGALRARARTLRKYDADPFAGLT